MEKALKIRDVTLRDGQQSLFANRMRQESINKLLPLYRDAGFYIMEVWGGGVPEAVMKYLNENPWDRLRACSDAMKGVSLLSALSRGRNLFGYFPYPDFVLEGFYKEAFKNGLNIMRVFDALNDMDNIRDSIRMINEFGGIPDAAVCYTVDPKYEVKVLEKKKGFFARLFGSSEPVSIEPEKIFTDEYFVGKARELEKMGAKMITLKDMGGLANPSRIFTLMPKLKMTLKVPVDFHTHCTPGYGLASVLTAIIKGVDIVDTNIWWFSGGSAAPALELVWIFCTKLGIPVDVNMEGVAKIRRALREVRESLRDFDLHKESWPNDFDLYYERMPKEIDAEFDRAIEAAGQHQEEELLDACHKIEAYFGFPAPNLRIKEAGIPGCMYRHMEEKARELKSEEILDEALALIPEIRHDAGSVPLVIPVSDIIGSQAIELALDRLRGNADYTNKNDQFIALVKGEYGKTPKPIVPIFRGMITGAPEERPYDVSNFRDPANPELTELGGKKLAETDEDYLLLELLPGVASDFLKGRHKRDNQRVF